MKKAKDKCEKEAVIATSDEALEILTEMMRLSGGDDKTLTLKLKAVDMFLKKCGAADERSDAAVIIDDIDMEHEKE